MLIKINMRRYTLKSTLKHAEPDSGVGFRVDQRCNRRRSADQSGQSVIEIIVAVAIMVIIAGSSVIAILGSFSTTRLAEEETQAALFASEGLEAVQSIRNQGWDDPFLATDCSTSTCGLSKTGDLWSFSGTSDDPDGSEKFTRTIAVEDIERDGNGDIVESGGTVDEDTKKITSTTTWDFTSTRQNTVEMVAYLTNWQTGKSEGEAGAIETCSSYCQSLEYLSGTCRQNEQQCDNNGETYESGGDEYCTGGGGADTCCCAT